MSTKAVPVAVPKKVYDDPALREVASQVWPSVKLAMDSKKKADGTISAGYLALIMAKSKDTALTQVRHYVGTEWQADVADASFLAEVKLASAFLAMFTKAGATHVVQGEVIGEDAQAFLARFGSLKKAKAVLRDSLSIPVQVKKATKSPKAKAGEAKEVTPKEVDPNGKSVRSDILAVFGTMTLADAEVLLAECADVVAKRKAKDAVKVTSSKAKATK